MTATRGRSALRDLLDALEEHAGAAPPPLATDPFAQILAENAAYLVADDVRAAVLARLSKEIGLTAEAVLAATPRAIERAIVAGGMRPPMRARKLLDAARIAHDLARPLGEIVRGPIAEARRTLRRFPGIGEPGADKILLFAGAQPTLGLDSNATRVLLRLGYGVEHASYDRAWRSVRDAVAQEAPTDVAGAQRAHQLLRRHGQTLCRRTRPSCAECPLRSRCPSAISATAASARPAPTRRRARSAGR